MPRYKNRIRRKNSDSLLRGEEILAAFALCPLGTMKRMYLSTIISQAAGAAAGAQFGEAMGSTTEFAMEFGMEQGFDNDDERSETQPRATASSFPDRSIVFVITDRRYLIFCGNPDPTLTLTSKPFLFLATFPPSAIIDMQLTFGLVANKVRLTFADDTFVLRELPHVQGNPRKLVKAFTQVRSQAFPPQPPPVQQVVEEQGD